MAIARILLLLLIGLTACQQAAVDRAPVVVMGKGATLDPGPGTSDSGPIAVVSNDEARGTKHEAQVSASPAPSPQPLAPSPQPLAPEVCGPAPLLPIKVCEPGASFLCVDTPPGGVTVDHVMVRGLVDRSGNGFAGLTIVAQHDETKSFQTLSAEVAADGRFTAKVPLGQLGAYTIGVQAFRSEGDPAIESVHVSRVIAPKLTLAAVHLDPDPAQNDQRIAADHLTVNIDLLPQCDHCDFIGSTTGATIITVVNTIMQQGAAPQHVTRVTNLGADGKYSLCVPVGRGENRIAIRACNATNGADAAHCPRVELPPFQGDVAGVTLQMQWPAGVTTPIFRAEQYPNGIPITFTLEGWSPATICQDSPIMFEWNRAAAVPLCTNDGIYRATVSPHPGINLGVVHVRQGTTTTDHPFTVGWGEIHSPWSAPGTLQAPEANWFRDAMIVGVRQSFMADTLRSIINHVAFSDEFDALLHRLTDRSAVAPSGEPARSPMAERLPAIRKEIPTCDTNGKADDPFAHVATRLIEPPHIGRLEITKIAYGPDVMRMVIEADDVSALLQLFSDENRDGAPDHKVIPLKIAFQKMVLYPEIRLVRGAAPQVVLTAPTDDCAFKSGAYCLHQPAILIPANFVGSATPSGGFVLCDHESQSVDDATAEGCKGLNTSNAQTGLFNEAVLDALNNTLYCDGSAVLTYLLREGFQDLRLHVGATADRQWEFPIGFDLVHSIFTLNERGMSARVASRVGDQKFFAALPLDVQVPTTGFIDDPGPTHLPADQGLSDVRDLTVGMAEGFVNQILFLAAMQGDRAKGTGVLDWDIDELFLKKHGFDYVTECDAFTPTPTVTKPSTFCNLRPRIGELLGSALTTAGYFPPKHPLRIRLRGDRTMSPRVRFGRAETQFSEHSERVGGAQQALPVGGATRAPVIEVQIPNLEISFYALQTDPNAAADVHGNPPLALDAAGNPRILSMRPEEPDPAHGPIIRFTVTVLLSLNATDPATDPLDPSQWIVTITTDPELSRVGFFVPPGGNATIVKDESLLSAFREKLLYGITIYGDPRDAIKMRVPKRWALDQLLSAQQDVAKLLGLGELRIGKEGLLLAIDPGEDYLQFGLNLLMTQRLTVDGTSQEWSIP